MKIQEIIKTGNEEGKEKHVPFIEVADCNECGELAVIIKVGETIFHPSTVEHHIKFIEVYGVNNEDKLVLLTKFELGGEPNVPYVVTHIKKGVFKSVLVLLMCNVHGLWENSVEI
jgi:superoxide reductase